MIYKLYASTRLNPRVCLLYLSYIDAIYQIYPLFWYYYFLFYV